MDEAPSASPRRDGAETPKEEAENEIRKVIQLVRPLPERISDLLQRHEASGRRVSAADDRVLRSFRFIGSELRGIHASLKRSKRSLLESELWKDYVDEEFKAWLDKLMVLAQHTKECLDGHKKTALDGCQVQMRRAVTYLFGRAARLPLSNLDLMRCIEKQISLVAEPACRYKHLLLAGDGDPTSRASSSGWQSDASDAVVDPTPRAYAVADPSIGAHLVGIQGALGNKLLRRFMDDGEKSEFPRTISMVGPAGVGKTTLAMEVIRQLQLSGQYFRRLIKAKVSRRPNMNNLLRHILSQIGGHEATPTASEKELIGNINRRLKYSRYHILIDDIWEVSDWDFVKQALPMNSRGSRIMITTRIRSVAISVGNVHEVKPLNELDSQSLVSKKAFGPDHCDGCPPENLKQSWDEILRSCEGIPLFLSGMADWLKEQAETVNQELPQPPQLLEQFEQTLSPTFEDLPWLLKVLVMYMCMFPEDYTFDKGSLIGKWIAEGLIEESGSNGAAEEYFCELINRNVITRVAESEHTSQVEEAYHWKVNCFMLRFLASKSAANGFLYTSSTLDRVTARGRARTRNLERRLSLHQPDPVPPTGLEEMELSHTRSLAISGTVVGVPFDKFIHLVQLDIEGCQSFKEEDLLLICNGKMFFLRYLSLKKTRISKLPGEIKELQNLQTLNISHTQISELPSQVCQLQWLEILDLRSTQIKNLPERIVDLQYLQHLLVDGIGAHLGRKEIVTQIPEGIRVLKELKTLETVDLTECSVSLVEALGALSKLRVVVLAWSFHQCTDRRLQEALRLSIQKWKLLNSLTIHCGLGCSMDFLASLFEEGSNSIAKFKVTGGIFPSIPEWLQYLKNLAFIEIVVLRLEEESLSIMGNLPSLECLVLDLQFIPHKIITIKEEWFKELKRLCVSCHPPWLKFNRGAMPVLEYLEIRFGGSSAKEWQRPSGLPNLSSLSEVALKYNKVYSSSVTKTVDAVRKEAAEHDNRINLVINSIQDQETSFQTVETEVVKPYRLTAMIRALLQPMLILFAMMRALLQRMHFTVGRKRMASYSVMDVAQQGEMYPGS